METIDLIVIGGGAAGFFAAINYKMLHPEKSVVILEKSGKILSKVRISGGGRCNVTHHCFDNNLLVKNYPRGEKELKQVFSRFSVQDTLNWFAKQGVKLKTEEDGRIFPTSNSSETIINCFLQLCDKLHIRILINREVTEIKFDTLFNIFCKDAVYVAKSIICSMGGNPKTEAYSFLAKLGHNIIKPVPSLFTINLPTENITKELQGISIKDVGVIIPASPYKYRGPLLITHWGMSGPAVLKLSAFAARHLNELDYKSKVSINWVPELKESDIAEELIILKKNKSTSLPFNTPHFSLPKRIWDHLILKSGIREDIKWANVNQKQINQLSALLHRDNYNMLGKTTFKEEFVTAGGIDLKEIDFKTMESKRVKKLFFCGEVLNIDGITGGFNFQAAWSTAYIAALNA